MKFLKYHRVVNGKGNELFFLSSDDANGYADSAFNKKVNGDGSVVQEVSVAIYESTEEAIKKETDEVKSSASTKLNDVEKYVLGL